MKGVLLPVAGMVLLACGSAWADSKTVNLTLRILVDAPPPCTVKGSAVEFGNVIIKNIDGSNYRQPVGYTLNCSNSVSDDLQMQLQGTTTTINGETVLSTGINGFGIRIQDASSHAPVALAGNNWLPFNVNSRPGFEAGPVKQSGTQLTASEFSATMTMVVEYQ